MFEGLNEILERKKRFRGFVFTVGVVSINICFREQIMQYLCDE